MGDGRIAAHAIDTTEEVRDRARDDATPRRAPGPTALEHFGRAYLGDAATGPRGHDRATQRLHEHTATDAVQQRGVIFPPGSTRTVRMRGTTGTSKLDRRPSPLDPRPSACAVSLRCPATTPARTSAIRLVGVPSSSTAAPDHCGASVGSCRTVNRSGPMREPRSTGGSHRRASTLSRSRRWPTTSWISVPAAAGSRMTGPVVGAVGGAARRPSACRLVRATSCSRTVASTRSPSSHAPTCEVLVRSVPSRAVANRTAATSRRPSRYCRRPWRWRPSGPRPRR